MDNISAILENHPEDENYSESSFINLLHYTRTWDEAAYWQLDRGLYSLCEKYSEVPLPKTLQYAVFRIHTHIRILISSHFDENDLYRISFTTANNDLTNWQHRVDGVFEGVFRGRMPANDAFELENPLLND